MTVTAVEWGLKKIFPVVRAHILKFEAEDVKSMKTCFVSAILSDLVINDCIEAERVNRTMMQLALPL